MRRALLLCGALLAAGPACALRAHDYLDEQRGAITLPADRAAPSLNVHPPARDAGLAPPAGGPAPASPPPSPVPEPSGWKMLGLGALLLLLMPRKRDGGIDAIRR